MKHIFIASKNKHKIKEMGHLLAGTEFSVHGLDEFAGYVSPEEDGETFIENAHIKALCLKSYLSLNKPHSVASEEIYVIADDSGLECEDIDGLPGVHSARFAGEDATDAENNAKLIEMINTTTHLSRAAQYVCALVLLDPDGKSIEIEETCQGRIVTVPRGENGFGYDPYFYLEAYGQTMAEISLDEKNKISHRGKALKKVVEALGES